MKRLLTRDRIRYMSPDFYLMNRLVYSVGNFGNALDSLIRKKSDYLIRIELQHICSTHAT
jgi:hypothetical protein